MSKRYYAVYIFIAAMLCALLCVVVFSPAVLYAEDDDVVALTPIGAYSDTPLSDTKYAYIDGASSVYADASGITVSGEVTTVKFAAETFITTEKQPSDKLYTVVGKDVILYNGEITYDGNKLDADGAVIDFDVCTDEMGSTLYAVTESSIIKAAVTDGGFDGTKAYAIEGVFGFNATAVAAAGNTVFVSYSSSTLPKFKNAVGAFTFTEEQAQSIELDPVLAQVDTVTSLAALYDGEPILYVLTAFDLSVYKMSTSGGIVVEDSFTADNFEHRLVNISAYNGVEKYIYALDSLSGVIKISADLSAFTAVIASASDMAGFFNTPSGITVKHSTLYVADTVNGRIAQYGSELTYAPHSYVNPVSVANDSKNTLYVAHNRNTVSLSYIDGTQVDVKLPVGAGAIKQIAVDTDKSLYILSAHGMYRVDGCADYSAISAPRKIENTNGITAFTLSSGTEEVYVLSALNTLDKLDITDTDGTLSAETVSSSAMPSGTFSVAVDIEKNIFALTSLGLTRTDGATGAQKTYTFTVGGKPYAVSAGQIALNTVKNEFIRTELSESVEIFVNAIILDTLKHRAFVVDGASIDLKLIDEKYEPPGNKPEEDVSPNPIDDVNRIIRTVLDDTPAFNKPVDMSSDYTLKKGRRVIVPVDQLNTPKEYLMVLTDDVATGKLIRVYVYKDALSEPLLYADPPSADASVYNDATPIYKWPSPSSPRIEVGGYIPKKGDSLMLKSFVPGYTDDYGNKWYRIALGYYGKTEGFVLANNVSLSGYEPTAIHPAYNATIIKFGGLDYAEIYRKDDDGKIVPWVDIPTLPAGTRVEVIGAFDSTSEYTLIKFFNSELNGSLTCYVRTEHIDYDGVNIVLLIAILVAIITAILIIVIIVRVMRQKKKRLINTVSEDVD